MEMYEHIEKDVTLLPNGKIEDATENQTTTNKNSSSSPHFEDVGHSYCTCDLVGAKKDVNIASYPCDCSAGMFKVCMGLVIVLLIAVSWTGATQFGKSTYSSTFRAPYFTTWFSTCFTIVLSPLFFISFIGKRHPWRLLMFFRESAQILGPQGMCLQSIIAYLVRYILGFCVLWLLTNYLYFRSLEALMPGTVTAVFSSHSCLVYILSLLFLKEKLYFIRALAVLCAVGGIILMSYSEGFGTTSVHSIAFVVISAFGSALYQVMFKRVIGSATGAQVALFLTLLGAMSLLVFWFVVVVFYYTEYELLEWNHVPWRYLLGTALLGLVFNCLVNFGISYTYPLFISVGTLLGMPMSALVDTLLRGSSFGEYKIVASLLILLGFCLMLLTKEVVEKVEGRLFGCGRTSVEAEVLPVKV